MTVHNFFEFNTKNILLMLQIAGWKTFVINFVYILWSIKKFVLYFSHPLLLLCSFWIISSIKRIFFFAAYNISWHAQAILHKKVVLRNNSRSKHQRTLWNPWGNTLFLKIVGRGAFGIVYKAKMRYYPYSIRAVKRIKKQFIKNPADIIK